MYTHFEYGFENENILLDIVAAGIKFILRQYACAYSIKALLLFFGSLFRRLMAVRQPIKRLRIWYNYGSEHSANCTGTRIKRELPSNSH